MQCGSEGEVRLLALLVDSLPSRGDAWLWQCVSRGEVKVDADTVVGVSDNNQRRGQKLRLCQNIKFLDSSSLALPLVIYDYANRD
jgi:hypothetical protein